MVHRYRVDEKGAKKLYKKIGSVSCSLFGGEAVYFNSIGFRHLILKHGVQRSSREIKRRFALLPYVAEIVEKSGRLISRKEKITNRPIHRHGKRTYSPSRATFWTLRAGVDGRDVTVIVRQFQGGKKHFLSVYDKKNKKLPS
ncbi:MAG: hypothetical protein ABSE18_04450 [Minisyncoccia bacterium]|jgi:hypothetical protein